MATLPLDEQAIFEIARRIDAREAREAYLLHVCCDEPAIGQRVRALLKALAESASFLEVPAAGLVCTLDEPFREGPGTVIGPYKLLEQIGEGAFGIVFMAEQTQPVRRKVALKVLKPGMDTRQVVARFEAERQALALMDHPNIARVLDGGQTPGGRPYFVMELVKGQPLMEYCDQAQLSTRERLELFVHLCQAVQHAHQKGIIHRDLKPSNVLVTVHDTTAVVKVIDFGVAKALGHELTDRTLFTGFAQMIGTPLYMSPEQAGQSGLDVDTRSDIYSLGVLLYELLTGTTPFDKGRFKEVGCEEMRRIICEEEPPRPSTRVSTLGHGERTVFGHRDDQSRRRSQLIRGELDWIVMKCLEKDRNRRYETANALALDVQRYLRDEPVQACPPSAWYRLGKFSRRNKRPLFTLAVVATALMTGTVASVWQAQRATQAQALAQERLEAAEANLLLARQAVDEMYTQVANELHAQPSMRPYQRDILVKALRFYEEFARRNRRDPEIRLDRGRTLLFVAQIHFSLGQRRQAKQVVEQAVEVLQDLAADLPAEVQRRAWLASAYSLRGEIFVATDRQKPAQSSFRQALAVYGELIAEHPDNPEYHSRLALTQKALGAVLFDCPREAEQAYRAAVKHCEKLVADQRGKIEYRGQLLQSYNALGSYLTGMGQLQEAEKTLRQGLHLAEHTGEAFEPTGWSAERPVAEVNLARVLNSSGRPRAAEESYRRAIAAIEGIIARYPDVAFHRQNLAVYSMVLATFLAGTGKSSEAAILRRSARNLFEKLEEELRNDDHLPDLLEVAGTWLRLGGELEAADGFCRKALILAGKQVDVDPTEPAGCIRLARSHGSLALVLQQRHRLRDAAEEFHQVMVIYERLATEFPDEPSYRYYQARALNFQGIALRSLRDEVGTAVKCHRQALRMCEKLIADYDQPFFRSEWGRSQFTLGTAHRLAGRFGEAVQSLQCALDCYRQVSNASDDPLNRSQLASVRNELAWLLATCQEIEFRDPDRAVRLAREAVEASPQEGNFWNTLGAAYYRAGNWIEARKALGKSIELRHGGDGFDWFLLAMSHWRQGERNEARTRYEQAVAWMEKTRPNDEELTRFRAEASELLGVNK
jgi:serine/threonine protein kinase/predicted negative regulator of RcsB-dependent stress response